MFSSQLKLGTEVNAITNTRWSIF